MKCVLIFDAKQDIIFVYQDVGFQDHIKDVATQEGLLTVNERY